MEAKIIDIKDVKKIEWENKIISLINQDNSSSCTVHFEYDDGPFQGVQVITYNPLREVKFLLTEGAGLDEVEALEHDYEKIQKLKEIENSYTVVWENKNKGKTETSYFLGKDIYDVLNKFYFKKVKHDYVIFEVKLNPIS